jgi:hypothetical protein
MPDLNALTIVTRTHVTIRPDRVTTVRTGSQGPPGPPGPSGSNTVQYQAADELSGHRAVTLDSSGNAVYADASQIGHAHRVIGITTGAASLGAPATIQTAGVLIEPSWAWTTGLPVYLSTNGLLSQAAPSSGFVLVVGFAQSPTTLYIHIDSPIILS